MTDEAMSPESLRFFRATLADYRNTWLSERPAH